MRFAYFCLLPCLVLWTMVAACVGADFEPWTTSDDPMAILWKKVAEGAVKLDDTSEKSFVESLLKELSIPIDSQVLVFSKTSLQNALISPARPRAIYFNEECYIGWVRGGALEIIAMDAEEGPQFYVLDPPRGERLKPQLLPSEQCFSCHEGNRTGKTKGLLVRSVFADQNGQPLLKHGSYVTSPESPLSERWGGWYVTGRHGNDLHMGNVTASESGEAVLLPRENGANRLNLSEFISTEPYLTDTSDIISLMVLEHQCVMHNTLTAAGEATREAIMRQRSLQEAFREPVSDKPEGSALSIIRGHARKVVKELLFAGEYELKDGGIEGGEAFQEAFRRNRHETKDGRSLKDLQLHKRLFKYRCSYMIYSHVFDALPAALKNEVYGLLNEVLSGSEKSNDFAYLSESERGHIQQILQETKPEMALLLNAK